VSGSNGARSSREETLQALRANERFVLTTHERPDGDAVGSLAAMQQVLTALGKDAVAFMPADEFPLPYEYRFIKLEGLATEPPPDLCQRTLIFLDCGNVERSPIEQLAPRERSGDERSARGSGTALIVNIDHHHDNTRFGSINHVDPQASCTAEMVWDLMHGLGVEMTKPIAEALYVGLVTDTGRFMYENTGPRAHEMAADLIAKGVDVHEIYRRLYEGIPQGKLELLARGLTNVERFDGGLITLTHLTRDDYRLSGADESYSEGVVDHLRSVEGTAVAGLVREQLAEGASARKVSLRATDDRIDVSRIARAGGGGGHRRAAGFSTDLEFPELVEFLRREVADQL
jgi:phosphoesterase RecJ-like protein